MQMANPISVPNSLRRSLGVTPYPQKPIRRGEMRTPEFTRAEGVKSIQEIQSPSVPPAPADVSWSRNASGSEGRRSRPTPAAVASARSEEHTSELQSRRDLVCRLLLEKKNKQLAHRQR